MTGDRDAKYAAGYVRAWAAIIVFGALVLGVALVVIGAGFSNLSPILREAFRAVGESVIASLILYVLVSVLLDPRRQQVQARQNIAYAIDEANRRFQERFEVSLPTAVYQDSRVPKPAFRDAFVARLSASSRYDFRGDNGRFTAYRLARCGRHPVVQRLDEVRLYLTDPRSERAVRIHAANALRDRARSVEAAAEGVRVEDEMRVIREDMFVSLLSLYDIRADRATTVYLLEEPPFFRCEMFDGGMFLTYYLDRARYPDYPETLEFPASTRPYRAYKEALSLSRKTASSVVVFGDAGSGADGVDSDEEIVTLLADLGCDVSLTELRGQRDQRFAQFDQRMQEGRISSTDLF
jgi:hypothetical protein